MVSDSNDAGKGSWNGAIFWAFVLAFWAVEGQCKHILVSLLENLWASDPQSTRSVIIVLGSVNQQVTHSMRQGARC